MKSTSITATLLMFMLSKICFAHSNAELQMDEEGYILGLPDYVQPIKFDELKRKFRAKNLELTVPNCLDQYFAGKLHKIQGTWFHHQTNVPPHVTFTWSGIGSDVLYSVPISLISAKPMYVIETSSLDQALDDGIKIMIDKSCQKEIDNSVKEIDL